MRALADDHEPRAGSSAATCRHASASPSTFLYASSIPTKSAVGVSGKRLRRRAREDREVDVGRERLERRDAGLVLGQLGGVARGRPERVGAAEREAGRPLEQRRDTTRAREPLRRGGAPVAARLDHERGRRAGGTRARRARGSRDTGSRRSRRAVGSAATSRAIRNGSARGREPVERAGPAADEVDASPGRRPSGAA